MVAVKEYLAKIDEVANGEFKDNWKTFQNSKCQNGTRKDGSGFSSIGAIRWPPARANGIPG